MLWFMVLCGKEDGNVMLFESLVVVVELWIEMVGYCGLVMWIMVFGG